MKKNAILSILLTLALYNHSNAGEIYWQSNNGLQSQLNCSLNAHSHSDTAKTNEYWLDCDNHNVSPVTIGPATGHSTIYFNGEARLICKMQSSIFGTNNNVFSMMLDCRTEQDRTK